MRSLLAVARGMPLIVILFLGLWHTSAASWTGSIMAHEHLSGTVVAHVAGRDDPPSLTSHLRPPNNYPPPSMQMSLLADWEPCESSSHCSNGCCASEHSNDGKLKCTPLLGRYRPDICVEKDSVALMFKGTTGTCGNGEIGNGICADGTCCSDLGWCGTSDQHCRSLQTSSPSTTMATCGNGFRGNGICGDGTCCSEFGWCGTDCSMDNSTGTVSDTGSTQFAAGELCMGNSQCISGFCCHAGRGQNGPMFRCSLDPCDDGRHDHFGSDGSGFDQRDQADFAAQDSTSPKVQPVYYVVAVGVILMVLLLFIIYLLIQNKRISCCVKAEPATEKPSAMAKVPQQKNIELQSKELTLPNTITISSNRSKRESTRQGQLVYPVVDPSISDQSSSYTTPSFPGTAAGRSTLHSIMSEPVSSIDGSLDP